MCFKVEGMKGTLVFDNLNDLIYLNCSPRFVRHVRKLAETQGLAPTPHSQQFLRGRLSLDPNILIQLFSPLVTSQRFMKEQFGNPYTTLQCEDKTNIVFQEYMNFIFLRIGTEDVAELKRSIGITLAFVTYLCGPDVGLLKHSSSHSSMLDNLLQSWEILRVSDQSFMIEGVSQLKVNQQLNSSLVTALEGAVKRVTGQLGSNTQALLFLDTKLLSWYSAKGALPLGSEDLLFLILLCHVVRHSNVDHQFQDHGERSRTASEDSEAQHERADSSSEASTELVSSSEYYNARQGLEEEDWCMVDNERMSVFGIMVKGEQERLVPQLVHVGIIQEGLYLVILSQPNFSTLTSISSSAYQQSVQFHVKARDPSSDKLLFEALESTNKKLMDILKKQKGPTLRTELVSRFDRFKSGFLQFLKTNETLSVQTTPLMDIYREIFRTNFNPELWLRAGKGSPESPRDIDRESSLDSLWSHVRTDTEDFWGFLKLKAKAGENSRTSLLVQSRENLSLNKYLEEFPGLVHFLYVDRNKHNLLHPTVDFSKQETVKLTKTKIWSMVKFAREHVMQGHFSLMWKDSAFNYAYFLWFEDLSGAPIRAKQTPTPWEGYPIPGIICGDFYKKVVQDCFPGVPSSKIRVVELFCIHLGLATSSCVLEHSKRLATNIYDEQMDSLTSELL